MVTDEFLLSLDVNYTFKEYLLVINPSGKVSEDMQGFKQHYHRLFGNAKKLFSHPHVSLCSFILAESLEKTLKMELEAMLKNKMFFEVKTLGFKGFKNNRLIFLQPEKEGINKLQWEMLAVLKSRVRVAHIFLRKLREPHLTVALAYNPQQYLRAWSHFSQTPYNQSFLVKSITVLSRPYSFGKKERWANLFELPLQG